MVNGRINWVYQGSKWEESFGKVGIGHEIALERQSGKDRKKKPAAACPLIVDEEQFVSAFNPFFDDEMPEKNRNFLNEIRAVARSDSVRNSACPVAPPSASEDEVRVKQSDPHGRSSFGVHCVHPSDARAFRVLLEALRVQCGGDAIVVAEYKDRTVTEVGVRKLTRL